MNNADIYEKVTAVITEALERGVVPWHRPWSKSEPGVLHQNFTTKKPYRGVNQLLCEVSAATQGFSSPYWFSKKQIKDRKGSWSGKGTLIVWWKILNVKADEPGGKPKTIPLLKYYYVWNLDQTTLTGPEVEDAPVFDPIERAHEIIDAMPNRPVIFHRGDRAFYSPVDDTVTLPEATDFESPEAYYHTAYHELAHSTGNKARLGRVTDWGSFGSDPYASEELVAELTAAMLSGTAGIAVEHEQSAAYIASWITQFQNDPKLIVSAAGKAQKAADYILGVQYAIEAPEPEAALVVA